MMQPKVSIIVTTYNVEPYIKECLDSVLRQTLKEIEVIVVDDGSTDGTPKIIEEYSKRDNRMIPVFFEKNTVGGVATAANVGIEKATGKYLGFADGDDIYGLHMFEKLFQACEVYEAELSMCNYKLLNDSDGKVSHPADMGSWSFFAHREGFVDLTDIQTRKHVLGFIAVPWRKLYRRDLIIQNHIRFPEGDYFFEDNPFHWMVVLSAEKLAVVPEALCQHRMGRAGQTMETVDPRILKMFEHHDTIRTWLNSKKILHWYEDQLLHWTFSQFEWISQKIPKSMLRKLFSRIQEIIKLYSEEVISTALSRKGTRTNQLIDYVMTNDIQSFLTHLEKEKNCNFLQRPRDGSLVKLGLYHLKTNGVKHTARKSLEYLSLHSKILRGLSCLIGFGKYKNKSNEMDLYFSVLENQLDREFSQIKHRLDSLEKSLNERR